jgi:exoribonuclease-2
VSGGKVIDKGTLVEFRQGGDRLLAVLDRPEGKQMWVAIDPSGRSHKLRPRDMTYTVAGATYAPEDIPNFLQAADPYLDPDNLEVAWELLVEDNASTDLAGMAEILFSDTGPVPCYAVYRLLTDDKLYFKQKGDRYEPRPASQVNDLRHQQALATQREQEQQEFLAHLQACLAGTADRPAAEIFAEPPFRGAIDALERYAVLGDEWPSRAAAIDLLKMLDRPTTDRGAFGLLVDLGLWNLHENLFVRRANLPTHFSAKVTDVAQSCLLSPPPDPDQDGRLDLTHLKTYTIDDESTREIDDGLSLEKLPDGRQRIWIHIADPTRWISPGNDLDLDARKRSTTVYLPTDTIPMFPPDLATGPMSLVQGAVCCALSFGVILQDSGAVETYEIHPSLVKPTYRLTYEDVDEMLRLGVQAESELQDLADWAQKREAWRISQGAIRIAMPESSVKVAGDEISIEILGEYLARNLVAEMMILTGEVAACYGREHELPMPFRNQPQPELPSEEELLLLPAGPVRSCAIRRCMPRSEMSITPARHASLALDAYTQVTSPIRRYTDLLGHFQLKAHLRGDPLPFSSQEMQELVQGVSATAYEATLVERQTNRYWILEYLRRNSADPWSAMMLRWLREDDRLGMVLLDELGVELPMRFTRDVELGDRLALKVVYADPRQDSIQFQEVSPELAA